MKTLLTLTLSAMTTLALSAGNPFAEPYNTPHGTVPFDKIKRAHYEEAIDRGISLGLADIDAIVNNPEAPTFKNTIVAYDAAGADLNKVLNVFFNLTECLSDDEMIAITDRVTPRLSEYSTTVALNPGLWKRVKAVYDNRANENLDDEDKMLLEETYKSFTLNGALLEGAARDSLRTLNARLSELTNKFGQNVLKELNTYEVWLTAGDLDGLPESSVEAAALAAKEKGRDGEYLFTLAQPTYLAFMKYSTRRDLREKMYRLYMGRNTKGEYDNSGVMRDIVNTRLALANLLGFETYSDYALQRTMAQTPANVYNLLNRLRDAYRPAQKKFFKELADYAAKLEGHPVDIQPWDYSYYSNKLKNARYSYDEESLRPYFELSNTINGVFGLAGKLYGVTFRENPDIPVYHPDVKAYEVIDPDGKYMGVIYTDFFPRESKRPGAWMTEFKGEWANEDGSVNHPHVSIVMNFTKPTADKPSLLTPYEVQTFLHEFGHALHGLMASTKYRGLSGTNVYRDFVELPSQFNENYMRQPEFLNTFARHYQTGEPLPQAELDKIIRSAQFGSSYACLRQLNFGYIDMAWHGIKEPLPENTDMRSFELAAGEGVEMFAPVDGTMMSPQFSHIFAGGYASGYYSYKWAEVLDADAFAVFKKNGIFDRKSAESFRDNILRRGGTVHPAQLYRNFRGQEPSIDALLERDGIQPEKEKPHELHKPLDR